MLGIAEIAAEIDETIDTLRAGSTANPALRQVLPGGNGSSDNPSMTKQVIDAVLEYMDSVGHKIITTQQLVDHFRQKGLFVTKWDDPNTVLGNYLYTEHSKKSGRIQKAGAKATWSKRVERQPNSPQKSA